MRNWPLILIAVSIVSCSLMPFQKWSEDISDLENVIMRQNKEAEQISKPDIFLYYGAYNACFKKNSKPYPEFKELGENVVSESSFIDEKSKMALEKISKFRALYGDKPLKTMGPEWDDYQRLLSDLSKQIEVNNSKLIKLRNYDHLFDSVSHANKIKSVPLLEYEADLASRISSLEDKFVILQNEYARFKREITSREDIESSMRAMSTMKQKIRRIESENLQLSNLYSRFNSLRSDAMIFEGPYIEVLAEVRLIEDKTKAISELLNQLEVMEEKYEE